MVFLESQMYALDTVRDVVRTMNDVPELMQEVADCLQYDVNHYQWVGVYLMEGQELILQSYSGSPEPDRVRIPLRDPPFDEVAEKGASVQAETADEAEDPALPFDGAESVVIVPILSGDETLGAIQIVSEVSGAFDDSDEEFLLEVAELLADVAESEQRY
jgi:GAF domain-containing protein